MDVNEERYSEEDLQGKADFLRKKEIEDKYVKEMEDDKRRTWDRSRMS